MGDFNQGFIITRRGAGDGAGGISAAVTTVCDSGNRKSFQGPYLLSKIFEELWNFSNFTKR